MTEMKFTLTDEAIKKAVAALAKDGLLTLKISRDGYDGFDFSLCSDDTVVAEMESAHIPIGGTFMLSGCKIFLEIDKL